MNYQIVDALNDLSGHVRPLDDVVIFAATYLIFVAFALFAILLVPVVRGHAWGTLAKVAATLGLAFVLGLVAASLHKESRPFTAHHDIHLLISHAAGQSFPSDHATAAFAMALAVMVFVSRRWGLVLLAMAVVIGLARVYTGVHYLGDILGSLAVVLLALALVEGASRLSHHRLEPFGPFRRAVKSSPRAVNFFPAEPSCSSGRAVRFFPTSRQRHALS